MFQLAIGCDNRSMRPFGKSKQVARRRERALDFLQQGLKPSERARRVGATRQSVNRWRRESHPTKSFPSKARKQPGRPSLLSDAKQQQLAKALKRGAYANGYAEDDWTLDCIAHVIWELFGIRYGTTSVWYLMQRLGWSSQKPQRRSLVRNKQEIAHWKHDVWPQTKKVD
jgi:transposase